MELSIKERHVLETKVMGMAAVESLVYLKKKYGYKMTKRNYYIILKKIKDNKLKRLFEIGTNFEEYHLERLDTFKSVQNRLWELYNAKKTIIVKGEPVEVDQTPLERTRILEQIVGIQTYYSAYYEATVYIGEYADDLRRKNSKLEEWFKDQMAKSAEKEKPLIKIRVSKSYSLA